ncbi:MAG TPA: hypothetical protein VFZ41_00730 [Solirubrobacterales bacterium]
MSRLVSARIALLDNQIVDCHRLPIGRADDLEIELGGGVPRITALLIGSQPLGDRIGGHLGRAMAAVSARLRRGAEDDGPPAIPVSSIRDLEPLIELDLELDDLPNVAALEQWLAAHFVERLPGSGDASE